MTNMLLLNAQQEVRFHFQVGSIPTGNDKHLEDFCFLRPVAYCQNCLLSNSTPHSPSLTTQLETDFNPMICLLEKNSFNHLMFAAWTRFTRTGNLVDFVYRTTLYIFLLFISIVFWSFEYFRRGSPHVSKYSMMVSWNICNIHHCCHLIVFTPHLFGRKDFDKFSSQNS